MQKGCYNKPKKGRLQHGNKKLFTSDYKKEIVKLVTELGKKPKEVAEDIGVTPTTVRRWVKQYSIRGDDAFPHKGNYID